MPEGSDGNKNREVLKMHGTIKFFNTKRGYGFAAGDDGKDVFIHFSNLIAVDGKVPQLKIGDKVEYEQVKDSKGLKAVNVELVG